MRLRALILIATILSTGVVVVLVLLLSRQSAGTEAGLIYGDVDERSDLFSLGVVLYGCLSGQLPFEAPNVSGLIRQQLVARPLSLREMGVKVPRALEQIVEKLLQREPRNRYQSAQGALSDIKAILPLYNKENTLPPLSLGEAMPVAHNNIESHFILP